MCYPGSGVVLDCINSLSLSPFLLCLSVGNTLDKLEWPSLDARMDRSSLLVFHKIFF